VGGFVETFAHYLHIVDTLSTVGDAGIASADAEPIDRYASEFAEIGRRWYLLAFDLNEVCRSLGQGDPYPFRLEPAVMVKLSFVHRLIAVAAGRRPPGTSEGSGLEAAMAVLGHGF